VAVVGMSINQTRSAPEQSELSCHLPVRMSQI
jgi:hypothetical protein